jgi:VWFA-related protein
MASKRGIVGALLCFTMLAQEQAKPPSEPSEPRIKVDVTEVVVPVTVLDHDNNSIAGLQPRQFRVYDNGKEQDIKVDSTYYPISLVICVQANAAVEAVLPQIRKIGSLLEAFVVGEQGEAALIAFDARIRTLQEFTNESDNISKAVQKIYPGSTSSRMIDSVQEGVRMLRNRPRNRRRVILLIGETRDVASEARLREVLIEAQLANVNVYTVNINRLVTTVTKTPEPPRPLNRDINSMPMPGGAVATPTTVPQKTGHVGYAADFIPLLVEIFRDVKSIFVSNHAEVLTKGTGGEEFSFVKQRGLEEAISRIGAELHSQYIIDYVPNNREVDVFHELKVVVNDPRVKEVRHRPGYWLAPIR